VLRIVLLVVVALALTVLLPFGSRRRVLCPLSAGLGLLAGLTWALVVLVS
jgi:hypothetical protein